MTSQPRLVINKRVLGRVLRDVSGHPEVEIGGRWVGHHIGPGEAPSQSGIDRDLESTTFVILDYIPTGPNPERSTAVELQPDRRYQLWTLSRMQDSDDRIEVLGSWHSHVPNGLDRFSKVDHHSYHSKINNPEAPYPFAGIVCSLIHQMPRTEGDVLQSLGHAWFAVGEAVGEHSWLDPELVIWKQMDVPEAHLLDLDDHSTYLSAIGSHADNSSEAGWFQRQGKLGINDWARAIEEVALLSGHSNHQLRMHPSGDRILLIEVTSTGVEHAVEIGSSGDATLHMKDTEGKGSAPMSSIEDAMTEFEDRLRRSDAPCPPWSHVNTKLAVSLRKEGLVAFIARIFGID